MQLVKTSYTKFIGSLSLLKLSCIITCTQSNMKCARNASVVLLVLESVLLLIQCEKNDCHVTEFTEIKSTQCTDDSTCPTWFTCNSQKSCECENRDDGAIVCDNEKQISAVLNCYCVTYDGVSGYTFVGASFYTCYTTRAKEEIKRYYHRLPEVPEMLMNNSACTPFHRTGLLCGDCEEGYSPLVLSYNLSCVKCPDGHKNWWKFILAGFVPLTLFYFFILFFSINITSSYLHGVVWFCQCISIPAFARSTLLGLIMEGSMWQQKVLKAFSMFLTVWNLDFFYTLIPDICLNISTVQTLALEYLIALYPYVLIMLTYFIIQLHDKNFMPIVIAWRPFKKALTVFRMSWDVHTSVIDSFATFFFLSYMKIVSISADLLIPTTINQLGSNESKLGLYYSPTVAYFGDQHLPYAILAIVILIIFVFIPTITIILYPFKLFQKFLALFPFNWHFLHAFIDSIQGCYKDGTEPGTYDCRWFSAVILIHRPVQFIIYGLTLSSMFYIYTAIILTLLLIMMINIEPFKKVTFKYFSTDITFFFLFTVCYIAMVGRQVSAIETVTSIYTVLAILAILSALLPFLYIVYLICSWCISRRRSSL